MASQPIVKGIQDGPPRGGYPTVRLNRGLPARGPPGWALWAGVIGCSMMGFYSVRVHAIVSALEVFYMTSPPH